MLRKVLEVGGYVAAVVLVAFGIASIVLGANGRDTVRHELTQQGIVGSDDMTPKAIAGEAKEAGLTDVSLPSCSVAGKAITTGGDARCFAQYMRIHALEATGGYAYAEMGRFEAAPGTPKALLAPGGGTDDEAHAVKDPASGYPAANEAREIWVTETALATALNTSYMAEQLANFGIVVGVALLLTGIGLGVLAAGPLRRLSGLGSPENW